MSSCQSGHLKEWISSFTDQLEHWWCPHHSGRVSQGLTHNHEGDCLHMLSLHRVLDFGTTHFHSGPPPNLSWTSQLFWAGLSEDLRATVTWNGKHNHSINTQNPFNYFCLSLAARLPWTVTLLFIDLILQLTCSGESWEPAGMLFANPRQPCSSLTSEVKLRRELSTHSALDAVGFSPAVNGNHEKFLNCRGKKECSDTLWLII